MLSPEWRSLNPRGAGAQSWLVSVDCFARKISKDHPDLQSASSQQIRMQDVKEMYFTDLLAVSGFNVGAGWQAVLCGISTRISSGDPRSSLSALRPLPALLPAE